jgi:hypothetical protein
MARTPIQILDGQTLDIYSASNTYLCTIYVDASGTLVVGCSSGDVLIGDVGSAANLVFEESSIISGQGTNTITLGVDGDTFNMNVSGVTYNVNLSDGGLFVLPVFTSNPVGAVEGQMYFNSDTNIPYWYDGSNWISYSGYSGYSGISGYSGVSGYSGTTPSLDSAWPIGSVFLSVVSTNPNTLLGFGTWSQIAQGQFLVGYKSGDGLFGTVEATGGASGHTHKVDPPATASGGPSSQGYWAAGGSDSVIPIDNHTHTTDIAEFDSGNGDNIPPYFVVYIWKRTA